MSSARQSDPQLEHLARRRLVALRDAQRYRTLRPRDPSLVDLTTNDYLGLSRLGWLQAETRSRLERLPVGAGGSRLLGGEHPIFAELEASFARFKGSEAALFFPSGYHANEGLATALVQLAGDEAHVFSDRLNHASIIDGIRLTGLPSARRTVYRHLDAFDLAAGLAASQAGIKLVFSESVYSMDGDRADVAALTEACAAHGATLLLDEAHAIYCLDHEEDDGGRGLGGGATITVNPCGKALGASGALVAGPAWLCELLINTARPFIYSTAASPWVAAALLVTLEHDRQLRPLRRRLAQLAAHVRERLQTLGYDTGASTTAIVPVLAGSDDRALAWSAFLERRGVLARAIRPPTVPEGGSRLRLSLSAGLSDAEVDKLLDAFAALRSCT
jgi:8-amino-7-oxononanoate synthase